VRKVKLRGPSKSGKQHTALGGKNVTENSQKRQKGVGNAMGGSSATATFSRRGLNLKENHRIKERNLRTKQKSKGCGNIPGNIANQTEGFLKSVLLEEYKAENQGDGVRKERILTKKADGEDAVKGLSPNWSVAPGGSAKRRRATGVIRAKNRVKPPLLGRSAKPVIPRSGSSGALEGLGKQVDETTPGNKEIAFAYH